MDLPCEMSVDGWLRTRPRVRSVGTRQGLRARHTSGGAGRHFRCLAGAGIPHRGTRRSRQQNSTRTHYIWGRISLQALRIAYRGRAQRSFGGPFAAPRSATSGATVPSRRVIASRPLPEPHARCVAARFCRARPLRPGARNPLGSKGCRAASARDHAASAGESGKYRAGQPSADRSHAQSKPAPGSCFRPLATCSCPATPTIG